MFHLRCALVLGLFVLPALPAVHKAPPKSRPAPATSSKTPPVSPLKSYTACHFTDGLELAEILPLPPDVAGRKVETLHGSVNIPLLRGDRVFFAYPGTDPFAKVTVEQLPAGTYDTEKSELISNFEQILASDNGVRNYALKPTLNGLEIFGLDRPKLQGGAVGVYLLVDDRRGIVSTIYFLDAPPDTRKFSTMAEYTVLRDRFLQAYTACIEAPGAAALTRPAAKPKPKAAATRGNGKASHR